MASFQRVSGANFARAGLGFIAPVADGLVAWFMTGGANALKNYAPGGADATIVGAPDIQPGFVSLKGATNFLQTSVPETAAMTLIAVARTSDTFVDGAHQPVFAGNYVSTGVGGLMIYGNPATGGAAPPASRLTGMSVYDNNGSTVLLQPFVAAADATAWRALSMEVSNTTDPVTRDLTNGLIGTTPRLYPRKIANETFRIGSARGASYQGVCDVAAFVAYNRVLTADERGRVYARLKSTLAKRGITV